MRKQLTGFTMADKVPGVSGSGPQTVPLRQASVSSTVKSDDEEAVTLNPTDTADLLAERLQAWKHAVAYIEEYVGAIEKSEKAHAKELEKVLKTISNPLREGHHFDQTVDGVAGLFENMRQNTQGLINSHLETEKNLKGSVLPILDRLHKEIKNKSKELASGAGKTSKEVEKARNTTQKHIELLGQHTAGFISSGGKASATEDPYVVQRGIYHRLNKQIQEENNHRHDLISVQKNMAMFEGHIIEVLQQAMMSFNQFVSGQVQKDVVLYSDIVATIQNIPPSFEWEKFSQRSASLLANPNTPDRKLEGTTFPNQNHNATKPLIEGTLERKSRNKLSFAGYSAGYYVVTPSKYLHEFKDSDNLRKDPVPELSIYLPDATIGALAGEKFNVKGRDVSKGIGSKLSGSTELAFKAHTAADASKWHEVILAYAGGGSLEPYVGSEPSSPVEARQQTFPSVESAMAGDHKPAAIQTSGATGGSTVASPTAVTGAEKGASP